MTPLAASALAIIIGEGDDLAPAALQDHLTGPRRELFEGLVEVETVMGREVREELGVIAVAPVPAGNGARRQAHLRVAHHAGRVEELPHPEPVALGAGARRVVEGEQPRLQLVQAITAVRAGETRGEHHLLASGLVPSGIVPSGIVHRHEAHHAARDPYGGLERFGQAQAQIGPDLEPVHHGLDVVLFV